MRRALVLCAIAGAGLASAAQAANTPPRSALTGFSCRHADNALNRQIAVTAVMRPVSGTQRLAMKFQLQRKTADSPYADVNGRDLGKWLYPTDPATLGQQPGDVWRVNKPVVNLTAGVYRFRISFRWIAGDGTALDTVVRLSRRCTQP